MTTFEKLLDAIQLNDVAGFLREYIVLVQQNVSLSFPESLKEEDVIIEWQELVPKECEIATADFFTQLAQLWVRLIHSVPVNQSSSDSVKNNDTLSQLLSALDKLASKLYSAPKLVEQGNIYTDISKRYSVSQQLFE